jgi:hypothetical protein
MQAVLATLSAGKALFWMATARPSGASAACEPFYIAILASVKLQVLNQVLNC